jgi:hypothetical protein
VQFLRRVLFNVICFRGETNQKKLSMLPVA